MRPVFLFEIDQPAYIALSREFSLRNEDYATKIIAKCPKPHKIEF